MTNHTDLLRRALDVTENITFEFMSEWASDVKILSGTNAEVYKNALLDLDVVKTLIIDLRTAIETGGWLPISEAKQDGSVYLLGNFGIPGCYRGYWEKRPNFWGKTGWFFADRQYDPASSPICAPDCFMPLPPPPNSPSDSSSEARTGKSE